MLSTIVVFRKDIAGIFAGLFRRDSEAWSFAWKVVVSMIPAAAVGFLLEDTVDDWFADRLVLVGACLLVTALLLLLTQIAKPGERKPNVPRALAIGIAQALAILPGISRSGATISTALYLGVAKDEATRFSFLMVIPLILGATAKMLIDGAEPGQAVLPLGVGIAGFVAAFLAGLAACSWMVAIVRRGQLWYFAVYCAVVGVVAIGSQVL